MQAAFSVSRPPTIDRNISTMSIAEDGDGDDDEEVPMPSVAAFGTPAATIAQVGSITHVAFFNQSLLTFVFTLLLFLPCQVGSITLTSVNHYLSCLCHRSLRFLFPSFLTVFLPYRAT
jgi:hypothetical protein